MVRRGLVGIATIAVVLGAGLASSTTMETHAEGLDAEGAAAIVAAADRSDEDRQRDARRHPAELLAFAGVGAGGRVADIGAGSGYTTELLVRAVGEQGVVYGHNIPEVIERYVSESWPARLAKPINQQVIRVDRSFSDPLPEDANALDLITMIYVYHDTPLYGVDRRAMAKQLYSRLKAGGALVVVDHHAKAESPVDETAEKLHRIDEAVVKRDLESAGFVLDARADFLRNPDDPRDAPFFKMEGPTDAFVHRWKKPAAGSGG